MIQVVQTITTIVAAFFGVFVAVLWQRLGMPDIHPVMPFIAMLFLSSILIVIVWRLDRKEKQQNQYYTKQIIELLGKIAETAKQSKNEETNIKI